MKINILKFNEPTLNNRVYIKENFVEIDPSAALTLIQRRIAKALR